MNDYPMDENVHHEQRNIRCDIPSSSMKWPVLGPDFSNSSNITKISVDSGLEMSNDSDVSNTVMQNDNNMSTPRMPMSYENLIEMFRHEVLSASDDRSRRINRERYNTYSGYSNETSCTIEEIDQPASSLSKDVLDSSYPNKQTFHSAQNAMVSVRNPLRFSEARVMRSYPNRNGRWNNKARKVGFKKFSRLGTMTALKHMMTINASRENRMCFAASTNHVEAVERLLNTGVSPNCRDSMGRTPLHIAGRSGYSSIVNLLLEHGADAKLHDTSGTTALQAALTSGDKSSITLLYKAVNQPSSRFRFEITGGFSNSKTNSFEPEVHADTDVCWMNSTLGFDQQVEALSNVCSRLSFSNSGDELQG